MTVTVQMIGREISLNCAIIDENIAKVILSEGISEESLQELIDNNITESIYGCYSYDIMVNGDIVSLPNSPPDTSATIVNLEKKKWLALSLEYSKRCEFSIEIPDEKFDISNISIQEEAISIGGATYSACRLFYGEEEAEFQESITEDMKFLLVDPSGEDYDIEIVDEDEYDEEGGIDDE